MINAVAAVAVTTATPVQIAIFFLVVINLCYAGIMIPLLAIL